MPAVPGPAGSPTLSVHTSPLRPAGHRRRRRHERLHRRGRPAARRGRRRGGDLHPGHLQRPAAGGRDGARACRSGTSSPGPFEGLAKEDLPGQLCAFTDGVLRAEAARPPGHYDLSTPTTGSPARSAGWPRTAGACRWCTPRTPWPRSRTPLLAAGDRPEPKARVIGEEQVVAEADRLVANTPAEAGRPDRPVRRRPAPGRRGPARASTWTGSARAGRPSAAPPASRLGLPDRRATWSRSSGGSSR